MLNEDVAFENVVYFETLTLHTAVICDGIQRIQLTLNEAEYLFSKLTHFINLAHADCEDVPYGN